WTPYHYVHQNPINLIDPTGMSAENSDGGGWLSRTWNKAVSFFSSPNEPDMEPMEHTVLDEIVISVDRKRPNWFQRNSSKEKLSNDWKNIKENTGLNHFGNWFKSQKFDGGYYFYDDDKTGKGDQSLRKTNNNGKILEYINAGGIMQVGSFAKSWDGTGFKYNDSPLDIEKSAKITNSLLTGYNTGKNIPNSKVQFNVNENSEITWQVYFRGVTEVKYNSANQGQKSIVIPLTKLPRTVDSLRRERIKK